MKKGNMKTVRGQIKTARSSICTFKDKTFLFYSAAFKEQVLMFT